MCLGGFSSRRLGGESQGRGCWRGGQLGSGCHLASTQRHLLAPRHLASTGGLPRGELLLLLQVVRQERHERLQQCCCKVRRLQVLVTLLKIHSDLSQPRLGAGQGCCEVAASPAISLHFLLPPSLP